MAATQGIRATELRADGIVDTIVPEYPDAADEPVDFALRMVSAIAVELAELTSKPVAELRAVRHRRYRRLGLPS